MLQNTIFAVNKEPYCIWEVDLAGRNREFLDGIDVGYFDYVTQVHLAADDEKRASIGLRIALHHGLEMLFSLLGAYTQATDCGYAWIAKCSNKELREFVKTVSQSHNDFFSKLNIPAVSWENIAESVFYCYQPGTARQKETSKLFSNFWRRLSQEYIESDHVDEYNSLKHGFRIRSGGFALALGEEREYRVAPPDSEMHLLGGSEHGTSFLRIELLGDKKSRSLRSRRVSINWKIEKVVLLLKLVSMSINNVVSALKVANGAAAGTCKFTRPQEDVDFERPWHHCPGVTRCSLDFQFDERHVIAFSKEELLERLKTCR